VGRDDAIALERLARGELELLGRLTDASNATFLCRIHDGGEETLCVYKPRRGERPLDDFPAGTLGNRERAAYLLSVAGGWGIVPPTILRDGPYGPGMVQAWVDSDDDVDVVELVMTADERLRPIALFDAIANNADRKGSHLLPVASGDIYGVDHGICFSADPKLRTVLWAWRGVHLTDDELAVVARVRTALERDLGQQLGTLLSESETAATVDRAQALLDHACFPEPDARRPAVPWPPF
jgi:hypothetical protein